VAGCLVTLSPKYAARISIFCTTPPSYAVFPDICFAMILQEITKFWCFRLVYLYGYSPDRTLKGYVNNSLAFINISDLEQNILPDEPRKNLNYTLPYCRYERNCSLFSLLILV
jgi:hypothetical protein